MYSVYVLRSKTDGKRYVGMTTDWLRRLKEHNEGKVFSTKGRVPFVLVYREDLNSVKEARSREKYLKSAAGRRFLDQKETMRP